MSTINPNRLYKNKRRGKIMGVCAGIADYFDINPIWVRILAIVSLFAFTIPTFLGYILAGMLLSDKPDELYEDTEQDKFYRSIRTAPRDLLSDLKHKFYQLEQRLRKMERKVTSREYQFDNDLDNS